MAARVDLRKAALSYFLVDDENADSIIVTACVCASRRGRGWSFSHGSLRELTRAGSCWPGKDQPEGLGYAENVDGRPACHVYVGQLWDRDGNGDAAARGKGTGRAPRSIAAGCRRRAQERWGVFVLPTAPGRRRQVSDRSGRGSLARVADGEEESAPSNSGAGRSYRVSAFDATNRCDRRAGRRAT